MSWNECLQAVGLLVLGATVVYVIILNLVALVEYRKGKK